MDFCPCLSCKVESLRSYGSNIPWRFFVLPSYSLSCSSLYCVGRCLNCCTPSSVVPWPALKLSFKCCTLVKFLNHSSPWYFPGSVDVIFVDGLERIDDYFDDTRFHLKCGLSLPGGSCLAPCVPTDTSYVQMKFDTTLCRNYVFLVIITFFKFLISKTIVLF